MNEERLKLLKKEIYNFKFTEPDEIELFNSGEYSKLYINVVGSKHNDVVKNLLRRLSLYQNTLRTLKLAISIEGTPIGFLKESLKKEGMDTLLFLSKIVKMISKNMISIDELIC